MARHGGTIPGKNRAFTTLVDPGSPPSTPPPKRRRRMVEAPGTAPGSETLIPRGVYRHSRFPDTTNISILRALLKASDAASDAANDAAAFSPWKGLAAAHRVRGQRRTTNNAPLHRPAGRDRPGAWRRTADLAADFPGPGGNPV